MDASGTCLHEAAAPNVTGDGIIVLGRLTISLQQFDALVDGNRLRLSPMELRLLTSFVVAPAKLWSKDSIKVLLGQAANSQSKSFKVHICRLRKKLTRFGLGRFLLSEYGSGYSTHHEVFMPQASPS